MQRAPANPFTQKEKIDILRYIIDRKAYHMVKGNAVWKQMAEAFPTHTWQSLKEHFKKRLFPHLWSIDLQLTQTEIRCFRLGYQGILAPKKKKTGKPRSTTPDSFYKVWSDDEDGKAPSRGHNPVGVKVGNAVLVSKDESVKIEKIDLRRKKKPPVANRKFEIALVDVPTTSKSAQEDKSLGVTNINSTKRDSDSSDSENLSAANSGATDPLNTSLVFDSDETNVGSEDCDNSYILGL